MLKKTVFIVLILFIIGVVAFSFIPFTPSTSPTLAHLSKSDALLIHSYWFSQKGNGEVSLSLRGELAVEAGAALYSHGLTNYIVISAGPVWGPTYPNLQELMENRLFQLGVPKNYIISQGKAMDTYEEVEAFLSLAKKYHWSKLVDLASAQHDIIMPSLYKAQNGQAQYLSTEDILNNYGTPTEKQTLRSLSSSFYEIDFKLYESIVRLTLIVDPHYTLLGKIAHHNRVEKSSYGSIPFLPIDKYDL